MTKRHHTGNRSREKVLAVLHGDGWVEIFAEDHVDVRMEVITFMESPKGEIRAEQLLELELPRRYRDLYFPGKRRAARMVEEIRPSDIVDRMHIRHCLKAFERIHDLNSVVMSPPPTTGDMTWI